MALIEELAERLGRNGALLKISKNYEDRSQVAHRVSAAALVLVKRLEGRGGAAEEVEALKAAAVDNGVIVAALAKIPRSVRKGVPTLPELQTSFDDVHSVGREVRISIFISTSIFYIYLDRLRWYCY